MNPALIFANVICMLRWNLLYNNTSPVASPLHRLQPDGSAYNAHLCIRDLGW